MLIKGKIQVVEQKIGDVHFDLESLKVREQKLLAEIGEKKNLIQREK